MSSPVRFDIHHDEIRRFMRGGEMRRAVLESAGPGVARARSTAPHRTGAGPASIRAEAVLDGEMWEARVSWDREHYYMHFHERGTRYLPARPFLVPAFR